MRLVQWLTIAVLSVVLAGCGYNFAPAPPTAPGPAEITKLIQDNSTYFGMSRDVVTNGSYIKDLDPKEYTAAGYVLVEETCMLFFNKLVLWQKNNHFLGGEIASVGAAAAGLLAIVGTSTVTLGIVGLITGLGVSTVQNFENFAAVTTFPVETKELVMAALRAAKGAKPAILIADRYDARSTVAAYADNCTYAGITKLSQQALRKGADNIVAFPEASLSDNVRVAVDTTLGGRYGLTDSQLGFLAILADSSLSGDERRAAVTLANFSSLQTGVLFAIGTQNLNLKGVAVGQLVRAASARDPSFAVVVADARAKLTAAVSNVPVTSSSSSAVGTTAPLATPSPSVSK
jgi:hypothetical protein